MLRPAASLFPHEFGESPVPGRALRICAKAGCRKSCAGKYCDAHRGTDADNRKRFDQFRSDDPIRKLYFTVAWAATRRIILVRDLFCRIGTICKGLSPSEVADHIVPAHQYVAEHNGDLESFYDESNLQGSCKLCHNAKTAKETGFGRGR